MIGTSASRIALGQIEANNDPPLYGLLPAFRKLDERIERWLTVSPDACDADTELPSYPGLTISKVEISCLLDREPGAPPFAFDEFELRVPLFDPADNANEKLHWLAREYDLSGFDLDALLIALATEVDLRYERIFAFLQDDITCKRPTVDLALNLLCASAGERQARRALFTAAGPLVRHDLLQLMPEPDRNRSFLAHQLKLDEAVVDLIFGRNGLDQRLEACAELIEPVISLTEVPIDDGLKRALQALMTEPEAPARRFHFRGPRGTGKCRTAEALAGQTGSALLVVDAERALAGNPDPAEIWRLILRQARFSRALLYVESLDTLLGEDRAATLSQFNRALSETKSTIIFSSEKPLADRLQAIEVRFPMPDFAQRRDCWEASLRKLDVKLEPETLDALAGSFRLAPGEIEAAISAATERAQWRAAGQTGPDAPTVTDARPTPADLFAAARARSSHDLARFTRKIQPSYDWADLVLPADQLSQLREICARCKNQQVIFSEWGFGRKLSLGRGVNALFTGHPGTGKTMSAEVIASELKLDLYKIDLSQVVSKYIGETEKSLNNIFREARASSAILFFDEADALFGKRTEVKDSHDRYANIEVSYLLQKMEEYEGITILATNLRQNIDEAFLRRMQFIVEFPFPDETHRRQIWQVVFPPAAPLAGDVNFDLLARSVRLAGGNLKNIALAAAFYAADDGRVIKQQHLLSAARREFQKLGRSWDESGWESEGVSG